MSFLGQLFGTDAHRYAQEATNSSNERLGTGYNQARQDAREGTNLALDATTRGYADARTFTNSGYGDARNTTNTFFTQARSDLNGGFDNASRNVTDYGRRAVDTLNPYVQSGYNNQALIDRLNGVGGTPGQTQGYAAYQELNGPLVAARDQRINDQMRAAANARGLGNSGRTDLAVARSSAERAATDYQNYVANLNTSATRGANAASQTAGIQQATGNTLADIEARRGTGLSGLSTQQGDRLAGYDAQQGSDLARLSTGQAAANANLYASQGNNLAGLTSGYYNALAGNAINLGSAQAQASQNGINNMLGLGSTVLGGFTPGKSGISPFGNIYSAARTGMNNLFS